MSHPIVVYDPRVCHDLASRSYIKSQCHTTQSAMIIVWSLTRFFFVWFGKYFTQLLSMTQGCHDFHQRSYRLGQMKKEEIWLSPMTKPNQPTEKSKSNVITRKRHKNFDYTTIADRLRAVSWSNESHQLVWLNRFTISQHLAHVAKFVAFSEHQNFPC